MRLRREIFAAAAAGAALVLQAQLPQNESDWSRIYLGSNPSVSGDGKTFAFEWNDHLWLADTAGGYARRLGSSNAADSWPVMSPDGKKIAFASDRDGGMKVFEFDIAGDSVRQISFHSEATYPRSWCPDAEHVMCQVFRDSSGPKTCERIAIINTEKREKEVIPFDIMASDPMMSPDGSSILFTRRGDELYRKRPRSIGPAAGQIWQYIIAQKRFVPMVRHETDCRNPIWRPDGKGFYYLDAKGGARNLWYKSLDGAETVQLTDFKGDHVFQPSLSADGKTMIFRQAFDFWRFDPTNPKKAPERILLKPEAGYVERGASKRRRYDTCWNNDTPGDVSFCDNGTQIAFTTGGDLYVMDTVICEPTLVQGGTSTHERECVFSPDGRALYYTSDRGDSVRIVKAEPADPMKPWWENSSFKKSVVMADGAQRLNFSISPEGSCLAWQDPSGKFTFADTNGNVRAHGPSATSGGSYAWSPDGKWVVTQLSDEFANSDVWILSTDGRAAPYNLSRNFKYDGEPAWSPDGKMIAFVSELPELGDGKYLRYVYLDRETEELDTYTYELDKARNVIRENSGSPDAPSRYSALEIPRDTGRQDGEIDIDFDDLADRVRTVRVHAAFPFFRWDSRTIAYAATDKRTDTIHIPDRLQGEKLFDCAGVPRGWVEKNDRVLWIVDQLPALGASKLSFNVYQDTNYEDYQELGFRTAWARIRDLYYDPNMHGADWAEIGERFLLPARYASSYSVFIRVMNMVLGELDSSHLGFYANSNSTKEWARKTPLGGWEIVTAHLGMRFEPENAPDGWIVRDVIPGGPADRSGFGIRKGDVVIAVDGQDVSGNIDPTIVLNGPPNRKVRVTFRRVDGSAETIVIPSCSFQYARERIGAEEIKAKRRYVHEKSREAFGYLNIDAMNWESLWRFQHEVFSEGYGRDGLIIDVRNNFGGFTADQMLQILLGADHSRAVTRTCGPGYLFGYWGRPVWSKPIVVLCNEATGSNGEIFSHAIKTLKRGKLVGRETGGGVIATYDSALLDLGSFRDARYGWFVLDGTDMEHHGAKPDFVVEDEPADVNAGLDKQLDKAIEVLDAEVAAWRVANPPIEFKFAR